MRRPLALSSRHPRWKFAVGISGVWLGLLSGCHQPQSDTVSPAAEPASLPAPQPPPTDVLAANMLADIQYLASDEMRGRYTLNEDIDRAAQWLASRFRSLGLAPVGADYVLPYELVTGVRAVGTHEFTVTRARGKPKPVPADAFAPLSMSRAGKVQGELVFVGYALQQNQVDGQPYDDLAEIDLQGKVALALLDAPDQPDLWVVFGELGAIESRFDADVAALGSTPPAAELTRLHQRARDEIAEATRRTVPKLPPAFWQLPEPPTRELGLDEVLRPSLRAASQHAKFDHRAARVHAKVRRLVEAGAVGIIFVRGPGSFLNEKDRESEELPELSRRHAEDEGAVVVQMTWKQADKAFRIQGKKLSQLQALIDRERRPHSAAVAGTSIQLSASLEREQSKLPNVAAQIPGTDLAHEVVVMGAHFDHVGYSGEDTGMCRTQTAADGQPDAVCNGADDNASGTAMVLEVARGLASSSTRPRRTVVFVLFSGEELGLLGSRAFVANPPFELSRTVAMLNLDMVGRLGEWGLAVGGVGTSPNWMPLLDRVGPHGVRTLYDRSVVSRSDHANFYEHQIPVLFFFTGLHDDYHRASDHVDKINVDGLQRIGEVTRELLGELSQGYALPFAAPIDGSDLVDALPGTDPDTVEKRVDGASPGAAPSAAATH